MITIKNVKDNVGNIHTATIESRESVEIDAEGKLTILPAAIDPHVHFRTPGAEHKEDWKTGALAAITGGVTTVFDMPNNNPACTSQEALKQKKSQIQSQLEEVKIPLRYHLYFGATKNNIEEIVKVKREIIGVKIFMGSSTGDLLVNDDAALDRIFQICAQQDLIVSVHAEDDSRLQENIAKYSDRTDPAIHSLIRDRQAAITATTKAISFAEKYNTRLVILHTSTAEEIELIRDAKMRGILVYCEVTPHHLFLTEKDYAKWGTRVQMNPPLRTIEDKQALWEAIHDGTVDFIGSDHAPHTIEEKNRPFGKAPSGIPGVETTLPLLFDCYHQGKLSLKQIIELTRKNIETIFNLPWQSDVILVDLEKEKTLSEGDIKSKCGWSPYVGVKLRGWPVYTIVQGKVFHHD